MRDPSILMYWAVGGEIQTLGEMRAMGSVTVAIPKPLPRSRAEELRDFYLQMGATFEEGSAMARHCITCAGQLLDALLGETNWKRAAQ
jgi:hypothetical protein